MSDTAAIAKHFRVSEEPLDPGQCVAQVQSPEAGGITTFIGTVRDHNEGRSVTLLEYQAYVPMAEKEMQRIADEIQAAMPEVKLAALHRVGSLKIGDLAVVCAASAPHREQAFVACRRLIDEIKLRVPVWKREHGPDGPYWVGWEDARCTGHEHHPSEAKHASSAKHEH